MDDGTKAALEKFDHDNIGLSKGALSLALILTRNMRGKAFPIDARDFETTSGGQVAGLGGAAVRKILADHGIVRVLSSEGGRTSRGNMDRMRLYVSLMNDLSQAHAVDLRAIEEFWVERVHNYFAAMPFTLRLDPSKSIRACLRALFAQALERQREASGTMYVGAMMQHLVGAKLRLVTEQNLIMHGHAVADAPTNRSADFALGDVAIHVTTAPSNALLEKCSQNLSVGLRPIIVTTEDGAGGARALSRQIGIEDRIDVLELEQFLAGNIYERSVFDKGLRPEFIGRLISSYNEIIEATETDPSLRIEIED